MVYTKLVFLALISTALVSHGSLDNLSPLIAADTKLTLVFQTVAITFVAFEGFQLAIHATKETDRPDQGHSVGYLCVDSGSYSDLRLDRIRCPDGLTKI
jgi:hypothetical protein